MASVHCTSVKDNDKQYQDASDDEGETEETLDPRVKGELDRLNSATGEINRLEQSLEEMHAAFRQTLTESAFVLKSQANKMGKFINLSRPYYEAMERSKQAQMATQRAALKYERACSKHQAAKEMVARAEQKLASTSLEHKTLDPTWQEMLNKATMKVMESEKEKSQSEMEHLETAHKFTRIGKEVQHLKSRLKTAINKSKSYFDLKSKYMGHLEGHKREIEALQKQLREAKRNYSSSLKRLEGISDEIHELRRSRDSLSDLCLSGTREAGVGAEAPAEAETPYEEATAAWERSDYGLSIKMITNASPTRGASQRTDSCDSSEFSTDGNTADKSVSEHDSLETNEREIDYVNTTSEDELTEESRKLCVDQPIEETVSMACVNDVTARKGESASESGLLLNLENKNVDVRNPPEKQQTFVPSEENTSEENRVV